MLFKFKQHKFKLLVEFNSLIATIQKMKLFTFLFYNRFNYMVLF